MKMKNDIQASNQLCLVTGGSRGLGRGIALELAQAGYAVAFTYNTNCDAAHEVAEVIKGKGGNAHAFQMAVEDRKSINNTLSQITQHFSDSVSILINNAAMAQEKPFSTIIDSDWEKMLKVNLQGPFMCIQEVLPGMLKKRWGRIINISSVGGQWGGYNQVHYAASKAGLINLTQSLAKLYSKDGITSNAVAIGLIGTDMTKAELETHAGKEKVKNIPLGRIGRMEEITAIVKFLASPDSAYVTGQTINANGGMYFG